ncbi:hypothetical protein Golax_022804 [Gossypium laxum]|uniref:DUF7745 domain-containing protein n=1 Tax=Gossypium laxum TaxID=34288 RepID=A0A7J9B192_9ROSI|nr:hypothetical protein [Gossypium laxum]
MDEHLFLALAQYWNPDYSCFTFEKVDLVSTIEEYIALLRCLKIQTDKHLRIGCLPKALGYVHEAVFDLFDWLDKRVTPVLGILAETFRSLNTCRKAEVEKVSYRVFSEDYSPLKELVATSRRDDILEEKWIAILQNLQDEYVKWRAPWMLPNEILYRYGDFD